MSRLVDLLYLYPTTPVQQSLTLFYPVDSPCVSPSSENSIFPAKFLLSGIVSDTPSSVVLSTVAITFSLRVLLYLRFIYSSNGPVFNSKQQTGLSNETESPEDAGAAARAALGGAQPQGGATVDSHGGSEGAGDEASSAGGKPTQGTGGAGSAGDEGSQQRGPSSNPLKGQAQGNAGKFSGSMQDYAGNLAQQFQGNLPKDSQGHLNAAKDSASSAVSVIYLFPLSLFSGLVSLVAFLELATAAKVIY